MSQHTSSEVIIFRLEINLNSKNTTHCPDRELTKLIDIKRQQYAAMPQKMQWLTQEAQCRMGRLGAIPASLQRLSCILIGSFHGMVTIN